MAMTVVKNALARGMIDYSIMANRNMKIIPVTLTFPVSYTAGGEPFSFSGVTDIMAFLIEPNTLYYFQFDYTNSKIIAYVSSTGAEVVAQDLNALGAIQGVIFGY